MTTQNPTRMAAIFTPACHTGDLTDISQPERQPALDFLAGISRSRALQEFSPSETAHQPWCGTYSYASASLCAELVPPSGRGPSA